MRDKRWQCLHEVFDHNQTHYCRYINLEELLSLGYPNVGTEAERDFIHEDERQFIVVHQMIELGFGQHIWTLTRIIEAVEKDDYSLAIKLTKRLTAWCQIYSTVMSAFRTMSPTDFARFRAALAPASGAESEQYRIIEVLSGIQPNDSYGVDRGIAYKYRDFLDRSPEAGEGKPKTRWWTKRLSSLSKGRTVRKAFNRKLSELGYNRQKLFGAKRDKNDPIVHLAFALVEYDKAFRGLFRGAHLTISARQMSKQTGTGHTEGVAYLQSTRDTAQFFPELWDNDRDMK